MPVKRTNISLYGITCEYWYWEGDEPEVLVLFAHGLNMPDRTMHEREKEQLPPRVGGAARMLARVAVPGILPLFTTKDLAIWKGRAGISKNDGTIDLTNVTITPLVEPGFGILHPTVGDLQTKYYERAEYYERVVSKHTSDLMGLKSGAYIQDIILTPIQKRIQMKAEEQATASYETIVDGIRCLMDPSFWLGKGIERDYNTDLLHNFKIQKVDCLCIIASTFELKLSNVLLALAFKNIRARGIKKYKEIIIFACRINDSKTHRLPGSSVRELEIKVLKERYEKITQLLKSHTINQTQRMELQSELGKIGQDLLKIESLIKQQDSDDETSIPLQTTKRPGTPLSATIPPFQTPNLGGTYSFVPQVVLPMGWQSTCKHASACASSCQCRCHNCLPDCKNSSHPHNTRAV